MLVKLNNIKIKTRLLVSFVLLSMIALVAAFCGYFALHKQSITFSSSVDRMTQINNSQHEITKNLPRLQSLLDGSMRANSQKELDIIKQNISSLNEQWANESITKIINFSNDKFFPELEKRLLVRADIMQVNNDTSNQLAAIFKTIQDVIGDIKFKVNIETSEVTTQSAKILKQSNENIKSNIKNMQETSSKSLGNITTALELRAEIMLLTSLTKDLIAAKKTKEVKYARSDIGRSVSKISSYIKQLPESENLKLLTNEFSILKGLIKTLLLDKIEYIKIINSISTMNDSKALKARLEEESRALKEPVNNLSKIINDIVNRINFEAQIKRTESAKKIDFSIQESEKNVTSTLQKLSNNTDSALLKTGSAFVIKDAVKELKIILDAMLKAMTDREIKYLSSDFKSQLRTIKTSLGNLPRKGFTQQLVAQVKQLIPQFTKTVQLQQQIITLNEQIDIIIKKSENSASDSIESLLLALENKITQERQALDQEISNILKDNQSNVDYWQRVQVITGSIAFIFALVVGFAISQSIIKPLNLVRSGVRQYMQGDYSHKFNYQAHNEIGEMISDLSDLAQQQHRRAGLATRIASGDLTAHAEVASDHDALGKALNEMTDFLKTTITAISQEANEVNQNALDLASASTQLSEGASTQSTAISEINYQMSEAVEQEKSNADGAQNANDQASIAKVAAQKGNDQMHEMVDAMNEINDASDRITQILAVIEDITDQTSLLALNAAIEAARAGEYGRGFAVVADEVRNLAARSQEAAAETAKLIAGTREKVKHGSEIANEAALALESIQSGNEKVTTLVENISATSHEQVRKFNEINLGIHEINGITEANTQQSLQTSEIAENLVHKSEALEELLSKFKV